jgi:hypothetical protein
MKYLLFFWLLMRNLLVPILVVIVIIQAILLWLWRDGSANYPRIFVQDAVYVVELLDEDMEDDSVRAVKYRLELLANEFGQWDVVDQSSTWACWPGRGHEEFGSEFCE